MKTNFTPFSRIVSGVLLLALAGCSDDKKPEPDPDPDPTPPNAVQLPRQAYYDTYPSGISGIKTTVTSEVIPLYHYGWSEAEDYRFTLDFPADHTAYSRTILAYTMGGMYQGPNAWDYTTMIFVKHKTGEWFELARAFTPYGNSFGPEWNKTFYMDVTEFLPMLEGATEFRVYFGGDWEGPDPNPDTWRRHTVTLGFDLYEGVPARQPVYFAKVYDSSRNGNTGYRAYAYGVPGADIEASERLGARTFQIPAEVTELEMRVAISGHGGERSEYGANANCYWPDRNPRTATNPAEFDHNTYTVIVDGTTSTQAGVILQGCSTNYPQAGTYQYDRANWCPGNPLLTHYWQFEDPHSGRQLMLNLDLERFVSHCTRPDAQGVAQYIVQVDLVGYKK